MSEFNGKHLKGTSKHSVSCVYADDRRVGRAGGDERKNQVGYRAVLVNWFN